MVQHAAGVRVRSSDKQSPQKARRISPAPAAATSADEFFPRDYFFTQATIAAMSPITHRIDIIPAGMTLPVRTNFGTNCAASKSEIMKAVANQIERCLGSRMAARYVR